MDYELSQLQLKLHATLQRLRDAMYRPVSSLSIDAWVTPEPLPYADRQSGNYIPLAIGQKWGTLFDCAWFNLKGEVPPSVQGKKVVLLIDVGGEGCIFNERGEPERGLTSVREGFREGRVELGTLWKRVVQFRDTAEGGEQVDIWVDAGCNALWTKFPRPHEHLLGVFTQADIAVENRVVRDLYYDFEVLLSLADKLPQNRARANRIYRGLFEASQRLRAFTDTEAAAARKIVKPLFDASATSPSFTVSVMGNGHLDLAWLWPIRETIRKGARTFSTVLELMDRYPDFIFGETQPQLYEWIKQHYPPLFERVKQRVREGRWIVHSAMWVEPDINIPSGESLVRQILTGKRWTRKELGTESRVLCLPDTFGYSAALPQIMKKSNIDYFITHKMTWNRVNTFPYNSFVWKGLDGTEVLAHVTPCGFYNASADARMLIESEEKFNDKLLSDRCFMLYGVGDGGGGPGAEHVERLRRLGNLDGAPASVQQSPLDFFTQLEKDRSMLNTWVGEMYLECHRGTYTSQAKNKFYNRKIELGLRQLELWSVLSLVRLEREYPAAELEGMWKEMLLYQFHDILPGSSITRVYDECLAGYEKIVTKIDSLQEKTDRIFAEQIDTSQMGYPTVITNSLSWRRREWLCLNDAWVKVTVPPLGYTTVDTEAPEIPDEPEGTRVSETGMENNVLRIVCDKEGNVISVYDKENEREVVKPGEFCNQLVIYDDDGDAWDISILYHRFEPIVLTRESVEIYSDGPLGIMENSYQYNNSAIRQRIVLREDSRRIDFITEVDWREDNTMLKARFPVSIVTDHVTCEIQYGHINRANHWNTSWDAAKYEICAHKWIDLSQPDYGVALLNDSKYGHKVLGDTMEITLLRSPGFPDPKADRGVHRFTYSLYPHSGDHRSGGVVKAGYELNVPLRTVSTPPTAGPLPLSSFLLTVRPENVIVEAVKEAEEDEGYIIRLYESEGAEVDAEVRLGFEVESAYLVNLLEEHPEQLELIEVTADSEASGMQGFKLEFGPFEIHTVKLIPK